MEYVNMISLSDLGHIKDLSAINNDYLRKTSTFRRLLPKFHYWEPEKRQQRIST